MSYQTEKLTKIQQSGRVVEECLMFIGAQEEYADEIINPNNPALYESWAGENKLVRTWFFTERDGNDKIVGMVVATTTKHPVFVTTPTINVVMEIKASEDLKNFANTILTNAS